MATINEYYNTDFSHTLKASGVISKNDIIDFDIPGYLVFDFISCSSFLSFFIDKEGLDLKFFKNFVQLYKSGYHAQWQYNGNIVFPSSHLVNGVQISIENKEGITLNVAFPGELPINTNDMKWLGQMYIYSRSDLSIIEMQDLANFGRSIGYHIQFRAKAYQDNRSMNQKPMAFISHDSSDKEEVASKIASQLTSMGCPVWYDEYSLKVGDSLRESIEKGIKECKHCIIVLSRNFISNGGWTKTEFESVFARQIHEKSNVLLPIWYNIEESDVYEYCPSLLNIVALRWSKGEEEKVCRKLFAKIIGD